MKKKFHLLVNHLFYLLIGGMDVTYPKKRTVILIFFFIIAATVLLVAFMLFG